MSKKKNIKRKKEFLGTPRQNVTSKQGISASKKSAQQMKTLARSLLNGGAAPPAMTVNTSKYLLSPRTHVASSDSKSQQILVGGAQKLRAAGAVTSDGPSVRFDAELDKPAVIGAEPNDAKSGAASWASQLTPKRRAQLELCDDKDAYQHTACSAVQDSQDRSDRQSWKRVVKRKRPRNKAARTSGGVECLQSELHSDDDMVGTHIINEEGEQPDQSQPTVNNDDSAADVSVPVPQPASDSRLYSREAIRVVETSCKTQALVSLREDTLPVALLGVCQLRLVSGCAVSLHGFTLRPSRDDCDTKVWHDVYSPSPYAHLVLSRGDAEHSSKDGGHATVAQDSDKSVGVERNADTTGDVGWVTLSVKRLTNVEALVGGGGTAYRRLLDLPPPGARLEVLGRVDLASLVFVDSRSPQSNAYREPGAALRQAVDAVNGLPVILVCGGKNTGKSTLSRYIVNMLLDRFVQVCYIDVDPGQTEFTPPGCLTLKRLTRPLFGPPWTHINDDDATTFFLGSLSPHDDPDHYLTCVHSLVDEYAAYRERNVPLVVNTMGWVHGVGLNLLLDTVRLIRPTLVVQLSSSSSSNKNLPPIVPELLHTDMWKSQLAAEDCSVPLDFINCHLWSADSADECRNEPVRGRSSLGAPQCRDLALLAYFGQSWAARHPSSMHSTDSFINSVPPYAVPFDAVAIRLSGGATVPHYLALCALNASVVALAIVDKTEMLETDGGLKVVAENARASYVGFGLVRAIDVGKKLLYITTPVQPRLLQNVNCLMKGVGIELPGPLFTKQTGVKMHLPYTGMLRQGVGTRGSQAAPRNFCAIGGRRK